MYDFQKIALLAMTLPLGCGVEPVEIVDATAQSVDALSTTCSASTPVSVVPSSAAAAIDDDSSTYYQGSNSWQYVTVDLGCLSLVTGLRRNMVALQPSSTRTNQGEQWQYSTDGTTWVRLTGTNAFGWEGYVNYGSLSHAWRAVDYGWSRWLRPNQPLRARYIRYWWDGNNDGLGEVDVDVRAISSSRPGIAGTTPWDAIDGDETTGLETGYYGWQSVVVDLGRSSRVTALRRNLTSSYSRTYKGEMWEVSSDGVTFERLTGEETSGWDAYINYVPHAWRGVVLGWSDWLEPKSPLSAQYVRYSWDGFRDRLNEVEIRTLEAGRDAAYDFAWTGGGFQTSLPDYSTQSPLLPPPTTWEIISDPAVGLTGIYRGEAWSNVGGKSEVSLTLIQGTSGEVRGTIHFVDDMQMWFGGFGCSVKTLPPGTRYSVRLQPGSNDGRFGEIGGAGYQYLYAEGHTSRSVDGFLISGTIDLGVYVQLQNCAVGSCSNRSTLTAYVEYSTPCIDGPPILLVLNRDDALLRKMVGL